MRINIREKMVLTNNVIEEKAVGAVRESILNTGYLFPEFLTLEKRPIWDGDIFLYSQKGQEKKFFLGRVPAQIKGKVFQEVPKDEIKYSVSVTDLKSFYRDGGVLFFVVALIGEIKKIYYAALSPTVLILLLKNSKFQKTKTIIFKEFPIENALKVKLVADFYENCKKQYGFEEKRMLDFESVKRKSLATFVLESTFKDNSSLDFLAKSQLHLYAKDPIIDDYIPILVDVNKLGLLQTNTANIIFNVTVSDWGTSQRRKLRL